MRLEGGFLQFLWSDIHVRFERRHSTVCPIVNCQVCFLRVSQTVHIRKSRGHSFKIGCGQEHLWSNRGPLIDLLFDNQIALRCNAARGTHCRYPSGQVHQGKYRTLLNECVVTAWARSRRKEVLMHGDQTRENGSSTEIENLGVLFLWNLRMGASVADFSVLNHHTLVVARCGSGSIDDADVIEYQSGGLLFHIERWRAFGDSLQTVLANHIHDQKRSRYHSRRANRESGNSREPK